MHFHICRKSCKGEVTILGFIKYHFYASPSSGEAYRDRQLTTNFEFWVEIFCVPTCFHMRIPKPCLSVHLSVPREKKLSWLRQYQSYISNWYINGKVFTSTSPWKPKNKNKKVRNSNFDLWRRAEISLVSSISVLHWKLIHQWKGLHEYYNMPMENVWIL